ncbi:hypothetical protein J0X14_04740 [Muricauda sp. CAU 1633]|uniref:GTP pyrophosphokinase n=1 Tax=Allomuricauda sp. CAU 1633 TaxID=2816036 RepID=UPI001A8F2B6B|nr:hypothetical protein [Muricauda sp. CAU 1633]MBO0321595.1 hypothetical protein [Muricauda sp. CAU 1633]
MEKIESNYNSKIGLYHSLVEQSVQQIEYLLKKENIKLGFAIESRVKGLDSILDKCNRYNITINDISEINDIAGIRLVSLFQEDVDKIEKIIDRNFKVLRKENTEGRLEENQFGYGSIHYEVTPPDEWFNLPTLSGLKKLKIEIQVRTAAQHIWAATSHILQYKREDDIPLPLRRTINRTAALLETVDLEFSRVKTERDEFLTSLSKPDNSDELNVDMLKFLMRKLIPKEYHTSEGGHSALLEDLEAMNIETVKQFKDLLKKPWYNPKGYKLNELGIVRWAMRDKIPEANEYFREKNKIITTPNKT